MFPNPQDALPLPPRPSLEQYKKRAKDLLKTSHSPNPNAIRIWAVRWINSLVRLSDLVITPELPVRVERWTGQLEEFARKKLSDDGTLAAAQFVIARAHGFESWPRLAKHLAAIARDNSPVNHFELAADAITAGDIATLERLLRQNPKLIRARSTRQHQATLLHYISANGVEGYRQKTPRNIVPIAALLLRAGADVNAIADVYGGSTTLALTATSVHPERAGVQNALLQLLLDHGATLDPVPADSTQGLIVNACLANGRGPAAEFLASRGARLDLEAAAGVGRLDIVQTFFHETGALSANATQPQMHRALLWASEYGRNRVVEFLLQRGASPLTLAGTGQTALHWAVIGGHPDTIRLLLQHGASLAARNTYDGTALGQALWSAITGDPRIDHRAVIETLLTSGAPIEDGTLTWLAQQKSAAPSASVKESIADLLKRHGAKS
jgi:ankyrin repeat protein